MRPPCVRVTLKCLFMVIAVIAAYLGGIVCNRALLARAWKDLDSAQKELARERQRRESDRLMYELSTITASDNVSSDRLADFVDRFNVHLHESKLDFPPPSAERYRELEKLERNLWRELSTGKSNTNAQNPAARESQ